MPLSAVDGWLASLRGCLTELSPQGWNDLHDFDAELGALVGGYDLGPTVTGTERSQRLLRIRADLARSGHLQLAAASRAGPTPVLHPLMQFICGYYDLDLRDAVGLGHGQLIASHATSTTRDRWIPCLLSGGLAGIALTERHGGSQIHATRTAAVASDGAWLVTGTKSWISRLYEADVFIVFFVDPDGDLTAAAIDSQRAGLERCPLRSSGLTGWSWGELHLRSVPVTDDDLLGPPGSGTQLIAEHFTAFRPLITATALGAAAAVLDHVTSELATRHGHGDIQRVRDNAAMAIGRSHAAINAALLAAVTAYHLAMAGEPGTGQSPS